MTGKKFKNSPRIKYSNISSYSLSIEEKTKLKHLINKNILTELSDTESETHFQLLIDGQKIILFNMKFQIFGKKLFSVHNKNWTEKEYLGIGPSIPFI